MSPYSRRDFLKVAGASASMMLLPASLRAQVASGRVVVIGGGFGGGTTAKYLRWCGARRRGHARRARPDLPLRA